MDRHPSLTTEMELEYLTSCIYIHRIIPVIRAAPNNVRLTGGALQTEWDFL